MAISNVRDHVLRFGKLFFRFAYSNPWTNLARSEINLRKQGRYIPKMNR